MEFRPALALALLANALACATVAQSEEVPADSDPTAPGSSSATTTDDPDTGGSSDGSSTTGTDPSSTGAPDDGSTGSGSNDNGDTQPSSGCGGGALSPGGHPAVALSHGGMERSYDVFVPPTHDGETPIPLVVNLHGWTVTPADHAAFSQMNVTAAERGFAVAYPAGIDESWNGALCCGTAHSDQLDDVGFVRAVVEDLDTKLCFDRRRVFASGHSNGAFLAHRLACDASDVFAAAGAVAGTLPISPDACNPQRPVPVMHIHGTADPIVSYEGGGFIGHPSALASASGWAARNGCASDSDVADQAADLTCHRWANCDQQATVELCAFAGMGHCWPGNPDCSQGAPSTTRHGAEMLADFFEAHPMP